MSGKDVIIPKSAAQGEKRMCDLPPRAILQAQRSIEVLVGLRTLNTKLIYKTDDNPNVTVKRLEGLVRLVKSNQTRLQDYVRMTTPKGDSFVVMRSMYRGYNNQLSSVTKRLRRTRELAKDYDTRSAETARYPPDSNRGVTLSSRQPSFGYDKRGDK